MRSINDPDWLTCIISVYRAARWQSRSDFILRYWAGNSIHDIPGFAEVRIADIIFGVSEQSGGWTGPTIEYPHYGLNVDGKNFALGRRWLEPCAVPQHGWTRNYKTALIYFRDPSGNLIELYCDSGYEDTRELALGPRQGGRPLPLEALQYRWNSAVGNGAERPRIHSFGHLSMPARISKSPSVSSQR